MNASLNNLGFALCRFSACFVNLAAPEASPDFLAVLACFINFEYFATLFMKTGALRGVVIPPTIKAVGTIPARTPVKPPVASAAISHGSSAFSYACSGLTNGSAFQSDWPNLSQNVASL